MQRIVLGYDASPAAERALQRARELGSALPASVVVASIAPLEPAGHGDRHTQLAQAAAAQLVAHGIDAKPVTGVGHTAETLVDVADATAADLIVVGMSSRDLVTRIFGGTSDDVAHTAHCDVLLVR